PTGCATTGAGTPRRDGTPSPRRTAAGRRTAGRTATPTSRPGGRGPEGRVLVEVAPGPHADVPLRRRRGLRPLHAPERVLRDDPLGPAGPAVGHRPGRPVEHGVDRQDDRVDVARRHPPGLAVADEPGEVDGPEPRDGQLAVELAAVGEVGE